MNSLNSELNEEERPKEFTFNFSLFTFRPPNEYDNQENYSINDNESYNIVNNQLEKNFRAKIKEENCQKEQDKKIINSKIDKLNKNNYDYEEIKNEKKKCGRKRKRTDEKGKHNKYSDDNIRRKCKHLVLKYVLEFINDQIKKIYNNNIGNGIFKRELQTINQSQKSDATINFNKNFLTKKLIEIFSEKISSRITNFPPFHNKMLIEKLINENDENKKNYFTKLFNLNFMQCLNHFSGANFINELKGLKCFNQIKTDILQQYKEDGEEYIKALDYYFNNFEEIINNKRSRKSRKRNGYEVNCINN